jgi:5'-nucleotidase / UDP-sugar diphosphatase
MSRNRNIFYLILFIVLVLFFRSDPASAQTRLRILHINDFHGYAESHTPAGMKEKIGGAAYLAARIDTLRKEKNGNVLLLSAGDMIQGHPWANFNEGKAVIELMNTMKFDAMVLGNHEFDFGGKVLEQRIGEAHFPVLAANVKGVAGVKPYVIREVGGIRVGILGIITEHTPEQTHPKNVEGIKFLSSDLTISKYLPELHKQTDIVILLTHIGYGEDRLLSGKAKGATAIIGGHSHTKVSNPQAIDGTIILQAWEHGKSIGILDIEIDNGKITSLRGSLEDVKPTGPYRVDVAAIVSHYEERLDKTMNQVIGKTEIDLDGRQVRSRETNLGNFITDVMKKDAGTEMAFLNGGAIRGGISAGSITIRDIFTVLPFTGYTVVMELRGGEIRNAFEHALAAGGGGSGGFLQVSGMKVAYNPNAAVGSRIKSLTVNGAPLDPARKYTVVTSDFLAAGGDGYSFFKAIGQNRVQGQGKEIRELMIDYIKTRGNICPRTEGRIKVETP